MGVAAEIGDDVLGPPEGRLGIDDPVVLFESGEEGIEGLLVGEFAGLAGKAELALLAGPGQELEILCTKDFGQGAHREQEAALGREPGGTVR